MSLEPSVGSCHNVNRAGCGSGRVLDCSINPNYKNLYGCFPIALIRLPEVILSRLLLPSSSYFFNLDFPPPRRIPSTLTSLLLNISFQP